MGYNLIIIKNRQSYVVKPKLAEIEAKKKVRLKMRPKFKPELCFSMEMQLQIMTTLLQYISF